MDVLLDTATHLDALDRVGRRLAADAERAGPDAAVATCPGWDVRALLAHVGMVHRWATAHVLAGRVLAADGLDEERAAGLVAPEDGLLEWYRTGHRLLLDALRAAPDDLSAMTFLADAGTPKAFWARRQAHETTIHAADVATALDEVPGIGTAFAADGIAELLEGFFGRRGGRLRADPPVRMRVAPTDCAVSWYVQIGPDARTITRDGAGEADCTLVAPAADLYLFLWNRRPAGPVRLDGDPEVAGLWHRLARVRWS